MRKGEQTRETIIARAAPIFNRQGYHGASMADIMAAVGLQKGGIYNHFANKEELAQAAFNHNWQQMRGLLMHALAQAGDSPIEQLLAAIGMHLQAGIGALPVGGCPIMNTAIEQDDGDPTLRAQAQAALDEWRDTLAQLVQTGIDRGDFYATCDPDEVATIIISGLEGALMLTQLYGDERLLRRAVNHLQQFVSTQLLKRK